MRKRPGRDTWLPGGAVWDSPRVADYLEVNRANWDDRVPVHLASPDYAVQRFIDDPAFISGVVRFDLPLLGDVAGLQAVHLQCHIGTDTISLARRGASMTGLDFSAPAVAAATELAAAAGADAAFVHSDVYAAPEVLGEAAFDLVYTGVGAVGWLPDIRRWARVVAALLRPGGRLFIRDGHPVLWSLEDGRGDDLLVIKYPYFEIPEPVIIDDAGTYVTPETAIEHSLVHVWNHGLADIVTALLDAGLTLTGLAEHDSVPWNALPGLMTRDARGEWRLTDSPARVPCTYTIQAVKPSAA
jgi:SAM-dependent methyltransferase